MSGLIVADLALDELAGGSGFVIAEWTAPPAPRGTRELIAPLHLHRLDDEAWCILEGSLGFAFDGREEVVSAGGAALAPAGTAHTFWNASEAPARYLIVMPPRVRELIAVLHDPDRRGDRSMDEVFEHYESVLLDG